MGLTEPPLIETIWQEDPFSFISPSEFETLGINPEDIPTGTFASFKHPSYLPSRFGGNAYGFGFFEVYDRLDTQDVKSLQRISLDDPEQVKDHFEAINRIYKRIGLLIRFSGHGKPYYLIPDQLVSDSLTNIRVRAQEISKVIEFHRKKYLKESLQIGLITHGDDLIINDLSLRFKEHEFIPIDALEKLRLLNKTLDLVIMTRDIHEIIFMEKFSPSLGEKLTKKRLENYASYIMGKVYGILKPEGEILIIANCYPAKSNQTIKVTFKTEQEEKQFILFSHLFKTKKRYKSQGKPLQIYISDLHKYLSGPYVERDILDKLLGVQELETMTLKKVNTLPYLNLPLEQEQHHDQKKSWPKILSFYFNEILFKSMIPDAIRAEWKKRFFASGYTPDYMILYLGQKRAPLTTLSHLKSDIMETRLAGCPLSLLAEYRNSFGYLVGTLEVLSRIKTGQYDVGLPEIFMERLKQPFENKKRRYAALNDVLKLMSKISRLHRIQDYLNPDRIEGLETKVIENLELLPFFGFNYGELREIFLIVVGHTTLGRVLAGKMNEKTLKPLSDLARSYDPQQAINLLRYCRLMIVAETVAARKTDMNEEQLAELFDLFESMVRVVIDREMDWDRLIDEKISSMGGIHHKIVRKTLKMMNHFRFLGTWEELGQKGGMEKESLADYDEEELSKIESVIRLIDAINRFENDFLRDDPLQLPIFYRKFLNMEFHGTGRLFEKMDSHLVFILLWITVNVARGEVINFNPILANLESPDLNRYVKKVEEEAGG
jgi:hypothetical protein